MYFATFMFFSIKNNDAYFYFTDEKVDGDAIRRLPYLLRNDGLTIRLDLLKRKDVQCLLLVDNKYELQNEVDVAVMEHEECSLYPSWATKFKKGEIEDVETYINLEGSWVVSYKYNNEKYLISIDLL